MRNSLVSRVTRGYVVLAAALVVFTCLASMAFALHRVFLTMNENLLGAESSIKLTADALAVDGQPFAYIARAIAAREQRPGVIVQVLDRDGHVVSGPAVPDRPPYIQLLATFAGLRPVEFAIPGGSVRMLRDPEITAPRFASFALFNVPTALLAIIVAWYAGRRITSQAVRPIADVTKALDALAGGDFSAKIIVGVDEEEVAALAAAFSRATATVAQAMGERDVAQSELRRFIADTGHELRTPLTVIIGYVNALRGGVAMDAATAHDILGTVNDESQRMRRIVEDLIVLARLDDKTATPGELFSLRDTVSAVIASVPIEAKGRVHDEGGDAIVYGDASALHCALRNVVDNALNYTRGTIDVGVRRDGSFALLTIDDRGPGMKPEDVKMAFERFYRGSNVAQSEGTGLGLAIVRTALEACGGSVILESSQETGTTVVLRIPLARSAQFAHDGAAEEAYRT